MSLKINKIPADDRGTDVATSNIISALAGAINHIESFGWNRDDIKIVENITTESYELYSIFLKNKKMYSIAFKDNKFYFSWIQLPKNVGIFYNFYCKIKFFIFSFYLKYF